MWLAETSVFVARNANELCFSAALLISLAFYWQYRKYEEEARKEEMIDQFMHEQFGPPLP